MTGSVFPLESRATGPWNTVCWLLLGGFIYFATARLGMAIFSLQPSNITLLWLPSGVGLVLCLWAGHRALPFIFLGSFAANAEGMALDSPSLSLIHTAVAAAADTLAACLAAAMKHRFLPGGLNRMVDLFRFMLFVCLVPTLISAVILALNLGVGGYIPWRETAVFGAMLLFADSLGMLVVYPLFEAWRNPVPMTRREKQHCLGIMLAVLGLVWFSFFYFEGLVFLVIPVLLYQVFHCREQGIYLTLTLAVCLTVGLAARNMGVFPGDTLEQTRFSLMAYLLTTTVVVLGMVMQHRNLVTETREREDWQFRASHDPLTGLRNRLSFIPMLAGEIERAKRTSRPFSLALMDIDHFKLVNDTHGHAVGDQVLRELAVRLLGLLRSVDVAARYGGEEFVILFPETGLEEAVFAMERVRTAFEQNPLQIGEQIIQLTISGGVAAWDPKNPASVDEMLSSADSAMYEAKGAGRNRIVVDKGIHRP